MQRRLIFSRSKGTPRRSHVSALAALSLLVVACGASDGDGEAGGAANATRVEVIVFEPPSLGAFLPAVIEHEGIDADNGVDLTFRYVTPDAYNAEFAAGHADVGGSAALLSEALRTEQGGDVTYLFNLFDYFGAVVTSSPDISELTDLSGKTVAAATGTTNFAMFQWFAHKAGLDVSSLKLSNQTTPGLSTMAQTGRADAVQLWEPAFSTLIARTEDIESIDMHFGRWEEEFGTDRSPYLGVAAQSDWAEANADTVQAIYDTYAQAAQWVQDNSEDAAATIAETIPNGNADVIQELIESNDRLQMHVASAGEVEDGIRAVFEAGEEIGYLEKTPPDTIIYEGLN